VAPRTPPFASAGNIAAVATGTETAAGAALAAPGWAERLSSRLPAEGRVLVLEDAGSPPILPRGRELERRPLGSCRAGEGACDGGPSCDGGPWDAVVVTGAVAAGAWEPLLTELRGALAERARLHLAIATAGGAASSMLSDAVGALYETGYCLLREEVFASDRVAMTLLEARADEHVVRSYRPGDEAAIQRLFDASFSPRREPAHWRWKYLEHPFGTLAISCAFDQQGELTAHYAAYPVRFRRAHPGGSETILCHQVGDTMTDRRFRDVGRGATSLLARTARHFYARHCEGRVAFNYGFNTGNIQRFSQLFVRARKVWDIDFRRAAAWSLRLDRPRRFRAYRASHSTQVDPAFDQLFERVAADYGLLVERRRPWLEWRYLRCPDRDLHLVRVDRGRRLVGWGVFRVEGERILWGDALVDPAHPGAVSAMLRHALAIPGASWRAAAGSRIEGWFSRHPAWWSDLIERLGFASVPEPQGLGMVYVPFLEDPEEELRTRYYLTMGDGDLF
jgi:hypothetical protein